MYSPAEGGSGAASPIDMHYIVNIFVQTVKSSWENIIWEDTKKIGWDFEEFLNKYF